MEKEDQQSNTETNPLTHDVTVIRYQQKTYFRPTKNIKLQVKLE